MTPFHYIARHVIEAQLIGGLGSDSMGSIIGIITVEIIAVVVKPRHLVKLVAASIHVALAHVSSTGGELPFGLGGQSEGLAGQLV